jgi:hypothetical protein
MIDEIISLCCKQDAKTWTIANKAIIKYIPAAKYTLVVPDSELEIFQRITNPKFNIQPESRYAKDIKGPLLKLLPQSRHSQSHWYLQQFIKLEILNQLGTNKIVVLWDGDTVPLQPINFINEDGLLNYFTGSENHKPYFETIRKLLGIDRQVQHSFISQSFPIKTQWFQEFKNFIESRWGKSWFEAILETINFTNSNAFSEYETLGTFITHKHREEICFSDEPWFRLGNSLIGHVSLIHTSTSLAKLAQYQYVSFEKWDRAKPTFFKVTLPFFYRNFIRSILLKLLSNKIIDNLYHTVLQWKGTLRIDGGVGIFSCCTVRLESILQYYNRYHATPKLLDCSAQFSFYKENDDEDISKDLFAQRDDISIEWNGFPVSVTRSSVEQQFSNYREICYAELLPFIQKYFSPSQLITRAVRHLELSSKIDYENTCVIRYRGTDKADETVQPPFTEILRKALDLKSKQPNLRFAIQTDDAKFRSFIFDALVDDCFTVEKTTWSGWDGHKDYIDFYASIMLLSKCKYIITTSGNGELWMMLFRGNANGVYQYLQHKEFIYGKPNKSYKPGSTSLWLSKPD